MQLLLSCLCVTLRPVLPAPPNARTYLESALITEGISATDGKREAIRELCCHAHASCIVSAGHNTASPRALPAGTALNTRC